MRNYGSSPFYNYIELIFRSKRLFIVSIVLATVTTSALALLRSASYTATALVLLSGTPETGPQQVDDNQLGSIKYKINVLNLVLKDPNFMKSFLQEAGLDRGMSAEQFDTYSKDVHKALSYNVGDNVLEISCKWKSTQAEDIVKAFYNSFYRKVMDQETLASHTNTNDLEKLVSNMDQKERDLELKIVAWQEIHRDNPVSSPEESSNEVKNKRDNVRQIQNQLMQQQMKLANVKTWQQQTAKTIINTNQVFQGGNAAGMSSAARQDPELENLIANREELRTQLKALSEKYTDINPRVVEVKQKLSDLETQIKQRQKMFMTPLAVPGKGTTLRKEETINPQYQELEARAQDLSIEITGLQANLQNAQADLKVAEEHLKTVPKMVYDYQQLIKDQNLFTTMRSNLVAKLEQARMEEQRDRDLHLAEMKMYVEPKAEKELAGAKSLIFFAVGPLLGIVIAFVFSLMGEAMDSTLRTPQDIERHLNKPVLAVLPHAKNKGKSSAFLSLEETKNLEAKPPSEAE